MPDSGCVLQRATLQQDYILMHAQRWPVLSMPAAALSDTAFIGSFARGLLHSYEHWQLQK